MPRQARIMLPHQPCHITQRGVNKRTIFIDDDDRQLFLQLLHKAFVKYLVALHAYVLMDNHVHLLATSGTPAGLALAMRAQGNSYVQAFNRRHGRCGPLWQGRFYSALVDDDSYLLSVYRYIELNPVRAGMVAAAEDHAWSSVRGNLRLRADPLLTPHPSFLAIAGSDSQRVLRYASFLQDVSAGADLRAIRSHASKQRPMGGEAFLHRLQETLGRPMVLRQQGRPPKEGG